MEDRYGPKWGGMKMMLVDLVDRLNKTGKIPSDPIFRRWIDDTLQRAYQMRGAAFLPQSDTTGWVKDLLNENQPVALDPENRATVFIRHMPYQDCPEGYGAERFGSLDPAADLNSPPLRCPLTQTLWAQEGNSYTQIVDFADIDHSVAMLAPGVSEDPNSPHFSDQVPVWARGGFRPAPLSRAGVEKIRKSSKILAYPGK